MKFRYSGGVRYEKNILTNNPFSTSCHSSNGLLTAKPPR